MGKSEKHVANNKELLKAMDTVIRFLNDETGIEPWLMCGLPDGWDEDDAAFIAADDEMMNWACKAFRHSMKYSSAGWFTAIFGDSVASCVAYGADDDAVLD